MAKGKSKTRTLDNTLPNKPSELILLALKDLKNVEKDKKHYSVDMAYYHLPAQPERVLLAYDPYTLTTTRLKEKAVPCLVCFAGAVMSMTLRAPTTTDLAPRSFRVPIAKKLMALDQFRDGQISNGLASLDLHRSEVTIQKICKMAGDPVEYDARKPKRFHEYMKRMAKAFAAHNL